MCLRLFIIFCAPFEDLEDLCTTVRQRCSDTFSLVDVHGEILNSQDQHRNKLLEKGRVLEWIWALWCRDLKIFSDWALAVCDICGVLWLKLNLKCQCVMLCWGLHCEALRALGLLWVVMFSLEIMCISVRTVLCIYTYSICRHLSHMLVDIQCC